MDSATPQGILSAAMVAEYQRVWAGCDIDDFDFESRPLLRPGFDLLSRRPLGSSLRGRYPKLVDLIEDSPAQARTAEGRVEGPGRAAASAMPPRPLVLQHSCEGGECDMTRKDYYGPRLVEQANGENEPDNDDQDTDTEQAEQDQ